MNVLDRLNKIKTVEDAEEQLALAKKYVTRSRNIAKNQNTLEAKLAAQVKVKTAERVLRDMRRLIFDIEDVLAAGQPATSVLSVAS
jgi:hypothetical protein